MTWFTLGVALVALLLLVSARARLAALERRLEDSERAQRRAESNALEMLEEGLGRMRRLLAEVARGGDLSPEMIEEGRLWRDASPEQALAMLREGALHVLDVRTPQETAGGVIPGAQHIPIGELEERWREVPKGKRTLVYCAAGGRSAAACEFLSFKGYDGLHNLEGGIGAWSGPLERPQA
jgi:rhodanese-related sulfurtransferase